MTIFINASNCHQGGGKTLLNSFISGVINTNSNIKYVIFVDHRFILPTLNASNINFIEISIFERVTVFYKIFKTVKFGDKIIYFGNLPPIFKFNNNEVILILSNRFYVDNISYEGFEFRHKFKLIFEKLYFKSFIKNTNRIIVQTPTMFKLLYNKYKHLFNIEILPFENSSSRNNQVYIKEPNTFIYVASLLPYKNHKRLLEVWKNLNMNGINPKLYLTIDQNNNLKKWIIKYVKNYNLNVLLLDNIDRDSLMKIYQKCEYLIYPSYFEAYGLPLIEALNFNLKVLVADVDYCWDLLTPHDFFNPYDISSIQRCVLRSLNLINNRLKILTPEEFITKI